MKIPGGYILQPRKLDESNLMREPPIVRELWLYLLRKVSHTDNSHYQKNCMRGQGFFKFEDIQEDLCWYVGYRKMKYSKPQISKALKRLCERNASATVKATRGVYVTILNYDYYQDPKNYEGNDEEIAKVNTKNKNVKNVKNERYGVASNVVLTSVEHERLKETMGASTRDDYIDRLSTYHKIDSYKSHYLTILNWWRKDGQPKEKEKTKRAPCPSCSQWLADFEVKDGKCPACGEVINKAIFR